MKTLVTSRLLVLTSGVPYLQLHQEAREADLEAEDDEHGGPGPRRQKDDRLEAAQGSRRQQRLQGSQKVCLNNQPGGQGPDTSKSFLTCVKSQFFVFQSNQEKMKMEETATVKKSFVQEFVFQDSNVRRSLIALMFEDKLYLASKLFFFSFSFKKR